MFIHFAFVSSARSGPWEKLCPTKTALFNLGYLWVALRTMTKPNLANEEENGDKEMVKIAKNYQKTWKATLKKVTKSVQQFPSWVFNIKPGNLSVEWQKMPTKRAKELPWRILRSKSNIASIEIRMHFKAFWLKDAMGSSQFHFPFELYSAMCVYRRGITKDTTHFRVWTLNAIPAANESLNEINFTVWCMYILRLCTFNL